MDTEKSIPAGQKTDPPDAHGAGSPGCLGENASVRDVLSAGARRGLSVQEMFPT